MKRFIAGLLTLGSVSTFAQADCIVKINHINSHKSVLKAVRDTMKDKGCRETNVSVEANVMIFATDRYESPGSYKCFIQVVGSANGSPFDIRVQTPHLIENSSLAIGPCRTSKEAVEELKYELDKALNQNL